MRVLQLVEHSPIHRYVSHPPRRNGTGHGQERHGARRQGPPGFGIQALEPEEPVLEVPRERLDRRSRPERIEHSGAKPVEPFVGVGLLRPFVEKLGEVPHVPERIAALMPIVAGMGGNAGTQTLTVVVRGIALGELTWSNARKALVKEVLVGIGNGAALGAIAAAVAWIISGNPMIGLVLGLAMVINLFVAALAGTLVPLGLRAANVDPALASSVFITTMTDVFGFLSFLGLATIFAERLGAVR